MNIKLFPSTRYRPGAPGAELNKGQEVFYLPGAKIEKIYSISEGKQRLIKTSEGRVFFIGKDTDSKVSPFASELVPSRFSIFEKEGEKAFFDSLIPKIIKNCMENFGTEVYQRQGEVFTIKIADSWTEVRQLLGFNEHLEKCFTVSNTHKKGIFRTRHLLTGELCFLRSKLLRRPTCEGKNPKKVIGVTGRGCLLISGTLEAPDHEMLYVPGIHVASLTAYRVKPRTIE